MPESPRSYRWDDYLDELDRIVSRNINQEVLSRTQFLGQVAKNVNKSKKAISLGGYSDVFHGRVFAEGRGEIDVAIKRLRLHIDDDRIASVSFVKKRICLSRLRYDIISYSKKKYTSGRS